MYRVPHQRNTAQTVIRTLKQGRRPVEEYITEFRHFSHQTGWNDTALLDQFLLGLEDHVKDELARVGIPPNMEGLIDFYILVDRRIRERRQERGAAIPWIPRPISNQSEQPSASTALVPVSNPGSSVEPMQIGLVNGRLPRAEVDRRRQLHLCLYCAEASHQVHNCPIRNGSRSGKPIPHVIHAIHTSKNPSPLLLLPILLQWQQKTIPLQAMVDSGASGCFLDNKLSSRLSIPIHNKAFPVCVQLVDGSHLQSGPITHETIPLQVIIGSKHSETLCFDIVSSPLYPIILGLPWLKQHDPYIHWSSASVSFLSPRCKQTCLQRTHAVMSILDKDMVQTNICLPKAYHVFHDVFDKQKAETLPPRRPYDCPIDLLPGTAIPYGRIYPLSEPELAVLKEYIKENREKGFIRPSTSPAGAGIFFVDKKDGGLRPCVDYRDLNKITVKNRYPLPLIPELLERLKNAKIYSKLDLRGAYNLVRMKQDDEWKTAFRSRYGHFEYTVMPYGLCNAPATFQHFINDVFRDLLDCFVVTYLDDILVFSSSLEDHRSHMRIVLQQLHDNKLYAKLENCIFETTKVDFLGFVLSPGQIEMDPKKVEAILSWSVPIPARQYNDSWGLPISTGGL
uniref:ribonuclease H n=1 Tax=Leptobrachium leishanense TaxID=445787 RepID=A0A8C5M7C9_9ANUR